MSTDTAAASPTTADLERMVEKAPTIHQAFAAVMAEIVCVKKDERNNHQNFNYRGIDGVVNACGPAMRRHGVFCLPEVLDVSYENGVPTGKDRTPMIQTRVKVKYTFFGPDGDSLSMVVPGESFDSGDKGTAKAMSVAMRVAYLQAFCIPTDEPDPDSEAHQRSPLPVTDEQWLRATISRLKNATHPDQIAAVGPEVKAKVDAGQVTEEDVQKLTAFATECRATLEAKLAQAAAEKPSGSVENVPALPPKGTKDKPGGAAAVPPGTPLPNAEGRPKGTITQFQQARLHALFGEAEIADRDAKIAYIHDTLNRTVLSSAELSKEEAATVMEKLERYIEKNTPPGGAVAADGSDVPLPEEPAGE